MKIGSRAESLPDQIQFRLGHFPALSGFFLEGMEHADYPGHPGGVDDAVRIRLERDTNLKDACPMEALHRHGIVVLESIDSFEQRLGRNVLHVHWKGVQIALAPTNVDDLPRHAAPGM